VSADAVGTGLHCLELIGTGSAQLDLTTSLNGALGRYRGLLHGVPIAPKDLCWTKNTVRSRMRLLCVA
jgi:hypothetical protein